MLFVQYPKCTTCQKAKAWLEGHGAAFEARDIKLQNPTEAELRDWHARSGLPLRRLFNTSGFALYRVTDPSVSARVFEVISVWYGLIHDVISYLSTDSLRVRVWAAYCFHST